MFYWLMKRVLAGPALRLFFRPWSRGVENVPATGGAILASNHLAVIDSFILPLMIDREIVFIGKSEYFTGTGVKGRLKAGFFRGVGTIPVDRSGGKASQARAQRGLFGIYPEGTRSPDGRLYRGKTGVARLALEAGVPVIPVAMINTEVAQPLGRVMPRPVRVGVVFGEPLDFSRYAGMEDDRFILRSVTDEIMYALMSLSGQEYVDVYAATAKARIAAGRSPVPDDAERRQAPGGRPVPEVQVPTPPPEQDGPPAQEGPAAPEAQPGQEPGPESPTGP